MPLPTEDSRLEGLKVRHNGIEQASRSQEPRHRIERLIQIRDVLQHEVHRENIDLARIVSKQCLTIAIDGNSEILAQARRMRRISFVPHPLRTLAFVTSSQRFQKPAVAAAVV